jgi:RNA polymerase sigma-70 factor (ECF subfamily)
MPDLPVEAVADRVVASVTAEALGGCLAAGLARLAGRDRDVLLLIAWADLSYAEVAEALGIPIGTVRSRLSRARRILRAALPDPSSDSAEGSA